jgi:hypothetical protein
MVSITPLNAAAPALLPRRDLIAIFAYLNRRGEELKPERDPAAQADGVLQLLASAARMQ